MTLTRYRFIFFGPTVKAPTVEEFTVSKNDKGGKVWIEPSPFAGGQRTFHNFLPGYETPAQAWSAVYTVVYKRHEEARKVYEATMDIMADWTSVVAGRFEKEAS